MPTIAKKYKYAVIASDVAIFTVKDEELNVLLIKMKKAPYINKWAVPGGLVKPEESVDQAALRHLESKTGVKDIYIEQLYTFGRVNRDPFGRVVSVAYFALIPSEKLRLKTTVEYADVKWFPVKKLPLLAYDHREIIKVAYARLQAKLAYSNIVYSLLNKEFTLSELQRIYELILEQKMDKRNFRKKFLSLKMVKKVEKKTSGGAHRPAELYSFVERQPQAAQIL